MRNGKEIKGNTIGNYAGLHGVQRAELHYAEEPAQ
jgi:hypothetical protein